MGNFDYILKSAQWTQKTQKSFGLSYQLSEMLRAQKRISKSFSGINMAIEIAKSMQQNHRLFENPTQSTIEAITKNMSFQSKFAIPQTTLDAITSINRQHMQLFGGIKAMTGALRIQSPAITQVNSLHFALGGISKQIAALAVRKKKWAIIENYEKFTEKILDFTKTLEEEVTEEQQRQFQALLNLAVAFLEKRVSALLIIDIFIRFASIHQYYDFLKDKPEPATKFDVNQISIKQDSVLHFINLVNQQFKQANEYRITNRICEVKLKPKSKTLTLGKLPKGLEVIVIQINHKWVYVSFSDPIDNLPQTGWIMKKYLEKPDRLIFY